MIHKRNEKLRNIHERLDRFIEECKLGREDQHKRTLTYLNMIRPSLNDVEYEKTLDFINWIHYEQTVNYWIGSTGSWRLMSERSVEDNAMVTRYLLKKGVGFMNGAALGSDYIQNEIVLKEGDPSNQLRLILPIDIETYIQHYKNSAKHGRISDTQSKSLQNQLEYVRDNFKESFFDKTHFSKEEFLFPRNQHYRQICYYFRDGLIGYGCDGIIPFCVNNSQGVWNTISHVQYLHKPVFSPFEYTINSRSRTAITDYGLLEIPGLRKSYPLVPKSSEKKE